MPLQEPKEQLLSSRHLSFNPHEKHVSFCYIYMLGYVVVDINIDALYECY